MSRYSNFVRSKIAEISETPVPPIERCVKLVRPDIEEISEISQQLVSTRSFKLVRPEIAEISDTCVLKRLRSVKLARPEIAEISETCV